MALILTRSPFHISRGALDPNAGLVVEIFEYNEGISTTRNTYTLSFRNNNFIDISNLVNSEFVNVFTYNSSTGSYEGSSSDVLLVRTTLSGTINDVAQSDVVSEYYTTDGYLYSTDSINQDFSSTLRTNGYYAGSSDTIYKLSDSSLNVPIINSSLSALIDNKIANGYYLTSTGWSVQSGDAFSSGVLKCTGDIGARNYTAFTPTTGNVYKVQFEILDYQSGNIALFDGSGGENISGFLTADGIYSYQFTQTQTSSNVFSLYSSSGFTGNIRNVFMGELNSNNYETMVLRAKYNGSTVQTKNISFYSDTSSVNQKVNFTPTNIDEIAITTSHGTKSINVETISECKYSPFRLTFLNKYGVEEDLWFFKRSSKTIEVTSEDFRANQFKERSAGLTTRSMREYNKNATEKMVLNSGFVKEELNESFKQLMLSEEVTMFDFDNSTEFAIKITSSSLEFKTVVNDKLINYTINVEFSNNTIDNIV